MRDVNKEVRASRPGFRQIAEELQEAIASGVLAVGQRLPTERVLQEQFGVSRSTVRKALALLVDNGFGQQLPNRGVIAMPGLRPSKTRNIAIIDGGSYVMRVLTVRLAGMLQAMGYQPVHLGGRSDYPMEYAIQRAVDGDFAGAIVWSYNGFPELGFLDALPQRFPIVALDHRLSGYETDLVTFDQEQAAYDATEQLIRQGCRRIGVTGMFDMLEVTHYRFRGYMHAMFTHGLQPEPADFVFTATSGRDEANTVALVNRLRATDRPDALLVLQDCYVPSTIEAALRVGLNLPRDLKISTIGDDISVDVNGAGMTGVAFDWSTMISEALKLLVSRIEEPNLPYQTFTATHRLHVRGLCGATSEDWTPDDDQVAGFMSESIVPRSRFRYASNWVVLADEPDSQR